MKGQMKISKEILHKKIPLITSKKIGKGWKFRK